MMNYVFPVMIIFSFVCAVITGRMSELSASVVEGGSNAVELLFRLVAMLCLWGGVMEIADSSGITKGISKMLSPLMKLIFPSLRKEKDALEAMRRLQQINPDTSRASDEMVVFVVMNTAAMHIIPTTVATLRGQYGSVSPMSILPASFLTSFCALTVAILCAKLGNRFIRGERNA